MKKTLAISALLIVAFSGGFAFNNFISKQSKQTKMKKVTAIGGIFFKCKDPKK